MFLWKEQNKITWYTFSVFWIKFVISVLHVQMYVGFFYCLYYYFYYFSTITTTTKYYFCYVCMHRFRNGLTLDMKQLYMPVWKRFTAQNLRRVFEVVKSWRNFGVKGRTNLDRSKISERWTRWLGNSDSVCVCVWCVCVWCVWCVYVCVYIVCLCVCVCVCV